MIDCVLDLKVKVRAKHSTTSDKHVDKGGDTNYASYTREASFSKIHVSTWEDKYAKSQ
jgi:hypothetical protein